MYIISNVMLVQHCRNDDEYSTRYFRVISTGHDIVSQRCTWHCLPTPPCNDENIVHCILRYFCNALLVLYPDSK